MRHIGLSFNCRASDTNVSPLNETKDSNDMTELQLSGWSRDGQMRPTTGTPTSQRDVPRGMVEILCFASKR